MERQVAVRVSHAAICRVELRRSCFYFLCNLQRNVSLRDYLQTWGATRENLPCNLQCNAIALHVERKIALCDMALGMKNILENSIIAYKIQAAEQVNIIRKQFKGNHFTQISPRLNQSFVWSSSDFNLFLASKWSIFVIYLKKLLLCTTQLDFVRLMVASLLGYTDLTSQ